MSHANAYMLMYRRVSSSDSVDIAVASTPAPAVEPPATGGVSSAELAPQAPAQPQADTVAAAVDAPACIRILRSLPLAADVPEAVLSGLRVIEDAERAADEVERKRREQITTKLWYRGQCKNTILASSMTVLEATRIAWELFGFAGTAAGSDSKEGSAVGAAASAVATADNEDEAGMPGLVACDDVNKGTQTANFDEPTAHAAASLPTVAGAVATSIPLSCIRLRKYMLHSDIVGEPLSYNPRPVVKAAPLPSPSASNAIVVYTGIGGSATDGWQRDDDGIENDPPPLMSDLQSADTATATAAAPPASDAATEAAVALPESGAPAELEDGLQRTLESFKITIYEEFTIETRSSPSEPWAVYDPNGFSIQVIQVSCLARRIECRYFICACVSPRSLTRLSSVSRAPFASPLPVMLHSAPLLARSQKLLAFRERASASSKQTFMAVAARRTST